MGCSIRYNGTLRIVEVVYAGPTTGEDLRESTTRVLALAKERGAAMILVDVTEIEFIGSLVKVYDLPARQYVEEDFGVRTRLALVMPRRARDREDAGFYVTACVNRGWNVRAFPDRENALEWLAGPGNGGGADVG